MEIDRTMPRERYEELMSQMRMNMQAAIDGRKKYIIDQVGDDEAGSTEEARGEGRPEA